MILEGVYHQYIYTSERLLGEVYQQARAHPRGPIQFTGVDFTTPLIGMKTVPRPDQPGNVFWLAKFALDALHGQICSLRDLDDQIRSASSHREALQPGSNLEPTGLYPVTKLGPTGLYLRTEMELTWCWLPVVNLRNPVAWIYGVHDDRDTKRRTLVGLCGSIKNYRGFVLGSLDSGPGDPWYPSSLMGLRNVFAARAEDPDVKDVPGHEAVDKYVEFATKLTSLHREYVIGAGWSEVLAEVLVHDEVPYKTDGFDSLILGAPLWVRTAPPPIGSDGKVATKPKPGQVHQPLPQPPVDTELPAPPKPQPEFPSVPTAVRTLGVAGATMAGIGGLLMVLGSLLPWLVTVTLGVGTSSMNGLQRGNGLVTLVLGVVTLLVTVTRLAWRWTPEIVRRSPIATGLTTGLVAMINYLSIRGEQAAITARPGRSIILVGVGIWALFGGAILAIVGGIFSPTDPRLSHSDAGQSGNRYP